MTPEQLALVQRTAALIEQAGDDFARRFYDHLFTAHPSARRLFPEDLRAQGARVVDAILYLASTAGDLSAFVPYARQVGQRLQRYGVHAADYPHVGEALLYAVAGVSGEGWTPAADRTWRCMYHLMAEAMLEGAEGGLFSESD